MFSVDEILDTLSNTTRRTILQLISETGKPVAYTSIWRRFDLSSTGNLNHHLQVLQERGLIARAGGGYVLTPMGRIVCAIAEDLEESYLRHLPDQGEEGVEYVDREMDVRPFAKGDMFDLLMKAGTMSSKGPLGEETVRREVEENRQGLLTLEARGIHGGRISSVLNLVAIEKGHIVGNISGREEDIPAVGLGRIVIDNLCSFGDPLVANRLVGEIVKYGRRKGSENVVFQLGDPEEVSEAALAERGARLLHEHTEKTFVLGL
jgi:DNA-binding HxlR family transcriptional regulator